MSIYLSRTPYTPPAYAEMAARNALMKGTTEAVYNTSVKSFAALKGVTVSAITYESDGLAVSGLEVLPDHAPSEKIPLMIYNRGGSGEYGMLSPGQVNALMAPFALRMKMGVLASNYRGNGGGEGREEFGGADVNDVLNLLEIGKQRPWWDGKNIFMLGWSRGGMMTYRAIAKGAPLTAAVVGAGITDLAALLAQQEDMERLATRLIAEFAIEREEAIRLRSAMCWPEAIHVPLLLLHGDADDRVDVSQARALYAKLTELGKAVRYVEYPGGDHALRREWKQWVEEALAWFAHYRR